MSRLNEVPTPQRQKEYQPRVGNALINIVSDSQLLDFKSIDPHGLEDAQDAFINENGTIVIPYGGTALCTYKDDYLIARYYRRRLDRGLKYAVVGFYLGDYLVQHDRNGRPNVYLSNVRNTQVVTAHLGAHERFRWDGFEVNVNFEPQK